MAAPSPAFGPAEWVVLTFPGTALPAARVLFSDQDLVSIAAETERDTTTLVLVWVNRWAAEFADTTQRHQAPACPP
ncbi:hypothetical protein FHX44_118115 [Pseudonocardia hierapolitana]|uniref:Uncharacterized protein n=1 Tax=Pseudonocardia hierapolitana TaxID=1128676 RepID=A0A561T4Y3_9PSEU|nr:hypothetical protein [Pseudonocardia hierapolitana]TWF82170.1 hypothetical protein FHX44_118115 [Pseudonocardia hierapolitana]